MRGQIGREKKERERRKVSPSRPSACVPRLRNLFILLSRARERRYIRRCRVCVCVCMRARNKNKLLTDNFSRSRTERARARALVEIERREKKAIERRGKAEEPSFLARRREPPPPPPPRGGRKPRESRESGDVERNMAVGEVGPGTKWRRVESSRAENHGPIDSPPPHRTAPRAHRSRNRAAPTEFLARDLLVASRLDNGTGNRKR